jgi:hypothetical protein
MRKPLALTPTETLAVFGIEDISAEATIRSEFYQTKLFAEASIDVCRAGAVERSGTAAGQSAQHYTRK